MIGDLIKSYRVKAGLSQQNLADKLCVQRQTVSKYERGTVIPPLDRANEIASLLSIPYETMMKSLGSQEDRKEIVNMEHENSINDAFRSLKSKEEALDLVKYILKDFKYDPAFAETLKTWTINYLYGVILYEMNNKESYLADNDNDELLYDLDLLLSDLDYFAYNCESDKVMDVITDKRLHCADNELEAEIFYTLGYFYKNPISYNSYSLDIENILKNLFNMTVTNLISHIRYLESGEDCDVAYRIFN